ncbi:MAG: hypothetical protein AAF384_04340 [Pseudomonadota bacterium]
MKDERKVTAVPNVVIVVGALILVAQIAIVQMRPAPQANAESLPNVPPRAAAQALSLGEPELLARAMMLWLQAFDNQPGISIPFKQLDYDDVIDWLALMLALDADFQYPLLAASRLYAEVPDPKRQRKMLAFIEREFIDLPERRWRWMTQAIYVAKHRLEDLPLALSLAETLAAAETVEDIPNWARQMRIFVLEDMGQLEASKVIIGGLLESGEITDEHEQWFLSQRLAELEEKIASGER